MFFWGVGGNSVRIHSWLIWGYPMIPGNSKCRLILQQTLVEQLFCHKCNRRATGVSDCTVTKQTRIVFNKEVSATITAATIWYLTPRRGSWEKNIQKYFFDNQAVVSDNLDKCKKHDITY